MREEQHGECSLVGGYFASTRKRHTCRLTVVKVQENERMELFRTDTHFIFVKERHSLWCDKYTGEFSAKSGEMYVQSCSTHERHAKRRLSNAISTLRNRSRRETISLYTQHNYTKYVQTTFCDVRPLMFDEKGYCVLYLL